MPETIRDYLKRRTRWVMAVCACGWLLLPLSAWLSDNPKGPPVPVLLFAAAVFAGALNYFFVTVRCPRCNVRFWQLAMEVAFDWRIRDRVNFCPYCGVSLDELCP